MLCVSGCFKFKPLYYFGKKIVFLAIGSRFFCQRYWKNFLCILAIIVVGIGNTLLRCVVLAIIKVLNIVPPYNDNDLGANFLR